MASRIFKINRTRNLAVQLPLAICPLLPDTAAITLTCICCFELTFLAGRNKMSVFFEILDNLLGNYLSLETPQGVFDRFVWINDDISHLFSHLLSAQNQQRLHFSFTAAMP